jgi:hypothetical protein
MRTLLAICLLVTATYVSANPSMTDSSATLVVKGKVLEIRDVQGYTYLRLKTKEGDAWVAVNRTSVKPGADVTIDKAVVMHDFESKAMQRTFKKIVFGNLASATGGVSSSNWTNVDLAAVHKDLDKSSSSQEVRVTKASGANARTIAEIYAQGSALKDKPVLLRAKVVKFNAGIMGKNWVHLRDGTGSVADGSNDILATTAQTVKVSDLVTVKGTVRNDKDFGAGYLYKVLIEDATFQR